MNIEQIKECIEMAGAFHDIASNYAIPSHMLPPSNRIYPVIVNYAFACELHFKAIYAFRNLPAKPPRIHLLAELFSKLDVKDQATISSLYSPTISTESLEEFLVLIDNAFNDWRYAYETEEDVNLRSDIFELGRFSAVLRDFANQTIAPDFSPSS